MGKGKTMAEGSRNEPAMDAKRFARLDKNSDGVLTADELPGHKTAPKQEQ